MRNLNNSSIFERKEKNLIEELIIKYGKTSKGIGRVIVKHGYSKKNIHM